jgi:hypothetical protein
VFTIEFFANSVNEPSGKFYLGSQQVTTDSAGEAAFIFLGPLPPSGANFITATATDQNNNTSEFSAVVS